jgi:uncharacterized protein YkwD/uncharacterized protein YukE
MSILRGTFILIVFFIGLYILRDHSDPTGSTVKSAYVSPFVQFYNDIKSSTTNLPGFLKNDNPQLFNMFGYAGVGTIDLPTATTSPVTENPTTTAEYKNSSSNAQKIPIIKEPVKTNNKPIVVPPTTNPTTPKVSLTPVGSTDTELSPDGIVQYTNVERLKVGLGSLKINSKLSNAAGNKLQDIFKQQYFEHLSPSGVGVSDLAKQSAYEYVVVGENLALGSFGSNQALLAAWMASPGHKANIIDPRYQDIGVAVGRGMFQGSMQWVAVQHFGKPLAACVHLDSALKTSIESNKNVLINLEKKITELKVQIEGLSGSAYREKAEEYNEAVKDYNVRLISLQSDVAKYNKTAEEFNACIGTNPNKN